MKVNNSSLSGTASVNVENRTAKLLFVGVLTDANKHYSDFETASVNTTIEVVKQSANGSSTVIQSMKLTDLLEIAAANEGAVVVEETSTSVTVRGTIELSDFGSIPLLNNEYFKVNFVALGTNITADLYAIDFPIETSIHNVYDPVFFNANSAKTIDVQSAKFLCLPADKISKLELYYPNGKVWQLEAEEIRRFVEEYNPESFVINGSTTPGGRNWYCLEVLDALQAKITLNAGANIMLVSYKNL